MVQAGQQRIEVRTEEQRQRYGILLVPVVVRDLGLGGEVLEVILLAHDGRLEVGRVEAAPVHHHHRREELVLEAYPFDLGLALLGVVLGFLQVLDRTAGVFVIQRGVTLLEHAALLLALQVLVPAEYHVAVVALGYGRHVLLHHVHLHHIAFAAGQRVAYAPVRVGAELQRHQHRGVVQHARREVQVGGLHRRRQGQLEAETVLVAIEQHHLVLGVVGLVAIIFGIVFLEFGACDGAGVAVELQLEGVVLQIHCLRRTA